MAMVILVSNLDTLSKSGVWFNGRTSARNAEDEGSSPSAPTTLALNPLLTADNCGIHLGTLRL
jgi:hypothetical protein